MTFKHIFILSCLAFILCFSLSLSAQEWEYYAEDDLNTHPGYSWVDEDGTSYHNISKNKVDVERNSTSQISNHVIGLDKNGNLKSLMQINNCTNRSSLMPFGKKQFLSAGLNCNPEGLLTNDSRVFNTKGKILKSGPGIECKYQSSVYTEEGYSIFENSLSYNPQLTEIATLYINNFTWDFKFSKQTIDLSSMNVLPNRYFTNISGHSRPVQSEDEGWVLPMSYCRPDDNAFIPTEGIVIKVKGEKIIWSYPENPKAGKIRLLQKTKEGYLVIKGTHSRSASEAHFISNEGKLIRQLELPNKGSFQQALMLKDKIIFLTSSTIIGTQSNLIFYDLNGQLLEIRELKNDGPIWINRMMPFGENSILITGILTRTRTDRAAFIWKIDPSPDEEKEEEKIEQPEIGEIIDIAQEEEEEEEEEELPSSVKSSNFQYVDERALSVSLFPNPTTININFVIDNSENPDQVYHLRIITNTGKLVREKSFRGNELEMDVSQLIAGTYFYTILEQSSDGKKFISGQFVKI